MPHNKFKHQKYQHENHVDESQGHSSLDCSGLDMKNQTQTCRNGHYVDEPQRNFLDGHCSTVQGLLDWFEVDLGFTELSFIQIDLCVLCDFVSYSRVSLSSCPFLDILSMNLSAMHCSIDQVYFENNQVYRVALISRLLKIIGLFCKRAL